MIAPTLWSGSSGTSPAVPVFTREECLRVAPDREAQDRNPEPDGGEAEERCPRQRTPPVAASLPLFFGDRLMTLSSTILSYWISAAPASKKRLCAGGYGRGGGGGGGPVVVTVVVAIRLLLLRCCLSLGSHRL